MRAYIKLHNGSAVEIVVKSRIIEPNGLVRIVDDCGVTYELHLCNVIFMEV